MLARIYPFVTSTGALNYVCSYRVVDCNNTPIIHPSSLRSTFVRYAQAQEPTAILMIGMTFQCTQCLQRFFPPEIGTC